MRGRFALPPLPRCAIRGRNRCDAGKWLRGLAAVQFVNAMLRKWRSDRSRQREQLPGSINHYLTGCAFTGARIGWISIPIPASNTIGSFGVISSQSDEMRMHEGRNSRIIRCASPLMQFLLGPFGCCSALSRVLARA
jgi:hypothetical protein